MQLSNVRFVPHHDAWRVAECHRMLAAMPYAATSLNALELLTLWTAAGVPEELHTGVCSLLQGVHVSPQPLLSLARAPRFACANAPLPVVLTE